jgi:hypothetical protein
MVDGGIYNIFPIYSHRTKLLADPVSSTDSRKCPIRLVIFTEETHRPAVKSPLGSPKECLPDLFLRARKFGLWPDGDKERQI